MLPVSVEQLLLSNRGFVVILREENSKRALPIFIGAAEAQSIEIQLSGYEIPRPLTHDLLKNVFDFLECRVMRVEVCDLREGTFYAKLVVDWDGGEKEIDCRPSDGIALALRCKVPVLVAEAVMDEAGQEIDVSEESEGSSRPSEDASERPPPRRKLSPLESLQAALQKAVEDERYEEAARYRDEIEHLKSSHGGN